MKRYMKYIKPYQAAFILAPLCMLTEVFGEIMLPKLMSLIVNRGVAERNMSYIIGIGLSLIHISEPTRPSEISYAVFCLKKIFLMIRRPPRSTL